MFAYFEKKCEINFNEKHLPIIEANTKLNCSKRCNEGFNGPSNLYNKYIPNWGFLTVRNHKNISDLLCFYKTIEKLVN